MDELFLSAFLSMGSSYEAIAFVAQTADQNGNLVEVPGPPIQFDYMNVVPDSPVAGIQDRINWADLSLLAAGDHTHLSPAQDHNTFIHATSVASTPSLPPCGLAGDMPCERPLDGTLPSIRKHLFLHGHRHRGREMVQCPWMGCSERLRWMNIPRHIRSVHLGVRMACPNCGRSFTRALGLAKHASSKNCPFFILKA